MRCLPIVMLKLQFPTGKGEFPWPLHHLWNGEKAYMRQQEVSTNCAVEATTPYIAPGTSSTCMWPSNIHTNHFIECHEPRRGMEERRRVGETSETPWLYSIAFLKNWSVALLGHTVFGCVYKDLGRASMAFWDTRRSLRDTTLDGPRVRGSVKPTKVLKSPH
jgi:hypothetical protein